MNKENTFCFQLEMEVRDYELDCEQIVNNAVYLHYMEHTRHKFCQEAGFPFFEMHKQGIDAVVRKMEIEYFSPLQSGDRFLSSINIERKGPKFIFYQEITKFGGERILKAMVTIVALKDGKLSRGEEIADAFKKYL